MYLSVCVPVFEMHGQGLDMLRRCLDSLLTQTYRDFEVVIADNSFDDKLKELCFTYKELTIRYLKNPKRGMAANTNYAITHAKGALIKILYQDDYLAHENALSLIAEGFKRTDGWLITACSNNPSPYYSKYNTLGSPSVLTILNQNPYLFSEELKWTLDLDYYHRLYARYGSPKILPDINVVIGLGQHQETNHLSDEVKYKEELINAERQGFM